MMRNFMECPSLCLVFYGVRVRVLGQAFSLHHARGTGHDPDLLLVRATFITWLVSSCLSLVNPVFVNCPVIQVQATLKRRDSAPPPKGEVPNDLSSYLNTSRLSGRFCKINFEALQMPSFS
jgi:hypothetical protein